MRNSSLPEASKTLVLFFTEFLRTHTRDSHMFLFKESPTNTRRFPRNNSNIWVPFNLEQINNKCISNKWVSLEQNYKLKTNAHLPISIPKHTTPYCPNDTRSGFCLGKINVSSLTQQSAKTRSYHRIAILL